MCSVPQWLLDIEIIDSHVHLIDIDNLSYDVVEFKTSPFLAKNWHEDMYKKDVGKIPITKTIFVEVNSSKQSMLDEISWIHKNFLAKKDTLLFAVVPNIPIERGKEAVIEWLQSLKPYNAYVRGARRLIQDRPDGFCTTPSFTEGLKVIFQAGLVFDLCIRCTPQQINDLLFLVSSVPEGTYVIDHIGKPDIMNGSYELWEQFITKLAQFNNVYCKISGVVTEAGPNWTTNVIKPYVKHCLNAFGYDRCMFGTDWFVCNINASIEKWVAALCEIVDGATDEEKRMLFSGTAKKVYRIEGHSML